ncbi:uncharacterized protein I303_105429 [Kwoniella dejecticola CBS 10117]|uniref:Pentatricopeptide repeat-containing protein-mitochondrial domain-containing protein n=1 Tax=Kwoniella dejecticola CBS 10117 TaxID=1296121 RepID=A0AAJ8KSA6_9TREE
MSTAAGTPRSGRVNVPNRRAPLPKLGRKAPNGESLSHLLNRLSQLRADSRRPRPEAYIAILQAAGDFSLSRTVQGDESDNLGWHVAQAAWEDAKAGQVDLGEEGMEALLRLSGVETAWNRVKNSYTPDEGLLLSMLNAAGRWGRPDFASTILEALPVSPQEQHLAPLLEAFCNAGEVPNAFHVLVSIREAGITPTMASVQPIVAVLSSVDLIDQAFYALEDMQNEGQPIDISALNALIDASSRLGDLQRARATQMAAADLGLIPNIDTFNLVLACCISARHRPLGDTILNEINGLSLPLNATTYQHMISLCLTQSKYEDAFYYLEKAKSDGFKPSYSTYDALVRKCVTAKDSRWRLVLDEMKILGYRPTNELHEFINNDGRSQPRGGKAHSSQKDEPRRAARVTRPASQVSYASRDRSGKATTPGPAA